MLLWALPEGKGEEGLIAGEMRQGKGNWQPVERCLACPEITGWEGVRGDLGPASRAWNQEEEV